MHMIYLVTALIIIAIALMLVDVVKSSTHLSKAICLNCITSYVIVFICMLSVIEPKNHHFIDVALIYALISLTTSVAFLKYIKERRK